MTLLVVVRSVVLVKIESKGMHQHSHFKARQQNIKIAVGLNVSFTILEVIGGLLTNSLAILADALHDFGDSIVLFLSLLAEKRAQRPPDKKRTFGYARLSLLAAIFSAIVLLSGSLLIISKAVPRLFSPEHVEAEGMILLAIVGIIFNSLGFWRLKRGESMNEKVLSWHLLEDVFGWVVILLGAIVIKIWDWHFIDPALTLIFTAIIVVGVVKNLRRTYNIFMQGVPEHIDQDKVVGDILSFPEIKEVHDVHIWSLEGESDIFTAHLVVEELPSQKIDELRRRVKDILAKHHIEHSTLEIETEQGCSGVDCLQGFC